MKEHGKTKREEKKQKLHNYQKKTGNQKYENSELKTLKTE